MFTKANGYAPAIQICAADIARQNYTLPKTHNYFGRVDT